MPLDDVPMPMAQKQKLLRQIQFALDQVGKPTGRACGLTEAEFRALGNERLVEAFDCNDGDTILDTHRIYRILPAGMSILSQAYVAESPPLQVSVVPPHKSIWRRAFEGTRSGLWDLIKLAIGAVIGWYLKKHFP
jgi:hypothetical protein